MKNFTLSILLLIATHHGYGQCYGIQNKNSLCLSGSAMKSVMPDTYTIIFGLEEYFEEDPQGVRKLKSLDAILANLKDRLVEFGLKDTKLVQLSVSSINQNQYGMGNQDLLRKSYGLISTTNNFTLLDNIVEHLRFKGLIGIYVKGEFLNADSLQTEICNEAIDDAKEKSDLTFEKLNLKKGPVLQVRVDDNGTRFLDMDRYNYAGNQAAFGQYTFLMAPSTIQCSVNLTFEIMGD